MSENETTDAERSELTAAPADNSEDVGGSEEESGSTNWWTTRFDRALSMIFILLLAVSLFTGYVARPRVLAPMRAALEHSQVDDISRRTPTWERPFLPWHSRELLVEHRLDPDVASEPLMVESAFSPQGYFLGARSIDPAPQQRRRGLNELERVLQIQRERYEPLERGLRSFSVATFFGRIADQIDLSRIEAFELFPARLHNSRAERGERSDADPRVIVLHIWCNAPSGVSASAARSCPSARRLVYPLEPAEDGSYEPLRNDMLL